MENLAWKIRVGEKMKAQDADKIISGPNRG